MKILKHGNHYKSDKIVTCGFCNCEFEYADEDVILSDDILFDFFPPQREHFVICPECGAKIHFRTVIEFN